MKKCCLILCTIFAALRVPAQNLSQWFSQKSTELGYYARQIAAYQVYLDWVEKGYGIVRKGLDEISELKNGEFTLHQIFFSSLLSVNPAIMENREEISDILLWQSAMAGDLHKIARIRYISADERSYLSSVYYLILSDCSEQLQILNGVLSGTEYQMSDDQRIREIDRIRTYVRDEWAFSQSFLNQALLLSSARSKESDESSHLKKYY
jgi:hypothetical protein